MMTTTSLVMIHGTIAVGIDWGVGSQFALLDWEQFSRHQHHFHCKLTLGGQWPLKFFLFYILKWLYGIGMTNRDQPPITWEHGCLKSFLSFSIFLFPTSIDFAIFSFFLFCDIFNRRVAISGRHIWLAKLKLSTDCEPDSFNFSICSAAPSQSFLPIFYSFSCLFIFFIT